MRRVLTPHAGLAMILLAGCTADLPTVQNDAALGGRSGHRVELPASQHDARPEVPILGECETEIQPAEVVGPGLIRLIDVGTCRISHLGLSTMFSDKIINLAAGTQTAQITLTAASGDLLHASGSGTNSTVVPGQAAFRVELTITGGTGRFSDATGMIVSEGVAYLAEARAQLSMAGTIRY
jgi:hypothetical protein